MTETINCTEIKEAIDTIIDLTDPATQIKDAETGELAAEAERLELIYHKADMLKYALGFHEEQSDDEDK